jgi:hypothetical protein
MIECADVYENFLILQQRPAIISSLEFIFYDLMLLPDNFLVNTINSSFAYTTNR